jgi:hypothetical protein
MIRAVEAGETGDIDLDDPFVDLRTKHREDSAARHGFGSSPTSVLFRRVAVPVRLACSDAPVVAVTRS